MAGRIGLNAAVPVNCHMAYARTSLAARMPHLLPVLAHIQDQKPGATVRSLTGDLFPGLDPLSRKPLDMCRDSGLAERDGARHEPTEDGALAVREGAVFADEGAMWKIRHTTHPPVRPEYRVLKLERATPREAGYNKGDGVACLDPSIEGLKDETMACSFGENTRFRIRDMDSHAKMSGPDMRATMRWRIDGDGSPIEISDGSAKRHPPPPADMTYGKAWGQLPENARIDGWDYWRDRLSVPYYGLDDAKMSMKRALEFNPEILGVRFDRLVRTVDIYPKSKRDAQLWARDMLAGRISEYTATGRYRRLAGDIVGMFPDFDASLGDGADHIPDYRSLLFWRIRAMEDRNL